MSEHSVMGPTVLVVDDQRDFRRLARQLLEVGGFTVVGEAEDARGALDGAFELGPDIVLLDVRLPDGSGIGVASALSQWERGPLVVLTSTADYAQAAAACGAVGFIPKSRLSAATLRSLIEAV